MAPGGMDRRRQRLDGRHGGRRARVRARSRLDPARLDRKRREAGSRAFERPRIQRRSHGRAEVSRTSSQASTPMCRSGPAYFDALRREFERNPRLGMAAGLCYELSGDGWEPVHVTHPYIRGASFTCRRECVAQLLPLEERLGWEGIAVVRANIRGWETAIFPDLSYFHHRPTGARDASRFASFAEEGDSAYYMWYRPSYMFLGRSTARSACVIRSHRTRVGLCPIGARRRPRHPEPGFRAFVRSTQSPTKWPSRAREITGRP